MKKLLLTFFITSLIFVGLLYVLRITQTPIVGATILFPTGGGTGTSTKPTYGKVLVGNANGTYDVVATSTLGISSGGTPGGSNTQVQFNDSGAFGGDADFTWDKTLNKLTLGPGSTILTANSNSAPDIFIVAGAAVSGDNAGGNISNTAGAGSGASAGGGYVERAGAGGATGSGGSHESYGGLGGVISGNGGSVFSYGGDAQGGNSDGGNNYIGAGAATGSGIPGSIIFDQNGGADALWDLSLILSDRTFSLPNFSGIFAVGTSTLSFSAFNATSTTATSTFAGKVQADEYHSSDGALGFTGTCTIAGITSITVKDGLIISCQ